jgi:hypothetical protein
MGSTYFVYSEMFAVDNQEHYSFLIPVVKALLEKLNFTLGLANHLPGLPQTQAGPIFFDDFQHYCQEAQWRTFMDKKVGQLLCFPSFVLVPFGVIIM